MKLTMERFVLILIFFAVLIGWFDIRHQIDSKTVILDLEQVSLHEQSDEFHALGLD